MKYVGSKTRLLKHILPPVIAVRKKFQPWVEPFVGGANVISQIRAARYGFDVNPYLIAFLEKLKTDGTEWIPKNGSEFSELDYRRVRENKETTDPAIVGYAGFCLSYGAKFFGGWCRDREGNRDYVREAFNNAANQKRGLLGVKFECCSYYEIDPYVLKGTLVYCDPPYRGTTKYQTEQMDYEHFWDWAKTIPAAEVFVSEYTIPSKGFETVWEGSVVSSLTKDTGSKVGIEKLVRRKRL